MGITGAHTEFRKPEEFTTPIILYVTEYCGYCRMAENLLCCWAHSAGA